MINLNQTIPLDVNILKFVDTRMPARRSPVAEFGRIRAEKNQFTKFVESNNIALISSEHISHLTVLFYRSFTSRHVSVVYEIMISLCAASQK